MLAPERRDIWVFKTGSRFFMFRKSSLELQEGGRELTVQLAQK
jgi:hypothetical protein